VPSYHLTEGIDADVQSAIIGIHSAWRKANQRSCSLVTYHQHGNTALGARHLEENVALAAEIVDIGLKYCIWSPVLQHKPI